MSALLLVSVVPGEETCDLCGTAIDESEAATNSDDQTYAHAVCADLANERAEARENPSIEPEDR